MDAFAVYYNFQRGLAVPGSLSVQQLGGGMNAQLPVAPAPVIFFII